MSEITFETELEDQFGNFVKVYVISLNLEPQIDHPRNDVVALALAGERPAVREQRGDLRQEGVAWLRSSKMNAWGSSSPGLQSVWFEGFWV